VLFSIVVYLLNISSIYVDFVFLSFFLKSNTICWSKVKQVNTFYVV